jgi:hypothetical protein
LFAVERTQFLEAIKCNYMEQLEKALINKEITNNLFVKGNRYYKEDVLTAIDNKDIYNKIVLTEYVFEILYFIDFDDMPDKIKILMKIDQYQSRYILAEIIVDNFYNKRTNNKELDNFSNIFIKEFFKEEYKNI